MAKYKRRIRCTAAIDSVTANNGTLIVHGWVASLGGGRVTGIDAAISGKPCSIVEQALHIPSPDVRAAFPRLDNSEDCRFTLRFRLPEDSPREPSDALLTLEPSFIHGVGERLWYVVAPSLPDPPQRLVTAIGGSLRGGAYEFLGHFVDIGGMKPSDKVLDVGCGVGRMTYGLVNYLDSSARYEGFDIVPDLIEWTQQEISTRHQNFRFQHVPVFNSFYNPTGHLQPTEFIFPYSDGYFDFIFLTSVLTHMPGEVVRHYMDEIRRVLKTNGRALLTCFLLNEESSSLIARKKSTLDLSLSHGEGKVLSRKNPDHAIGFEEGLFKDWLETRDLKVADTLYGNWCGRPNYVSYQDMLVIQG